MKLKTGASLITVRGEKPAPVIKRYRPLKWAYLSVLGVLVTWLVVGQAHGWLVLEETGLIVFDVMEERAGVAGELAQVARTGTQVRRGDLLFTIKLQPRNAAPDSGVLASKLAELSGLLVRASRLRALQPTAADAAPPDPGLELGRWGAAASAPTSRSPSAEQADLAARIAGTRAEVAALRQYAVPAAQAPIEHRAGLPGVVVVKARSTGEHVQPGDEILRLESDRFARFEIPIRASQYQRVARFVGDASKPIPVYMPDGTCLPALLMKVGTAAWDDVAHSSLSNAEGPMPYLAVLTPIGAPDISKFGRMAVKARFGRALHPTCKSWW